MPSKLESLCMSINAEGHNRRTVVAHGHRLCIQLLPGVANRAIDPKGYGLVQGAWPATPARRGMLQARRDR